jgi:hypothetical protein
VTVTQLGTRPSKGQKVDIFFFFPTQITFPLEHYGHPGVPDHSLRWEVDSYPENLGRKIVAEIPTDRIKLTEWKVWLEEKRYLYSEKAQLLEDCVLTIKSKCVGQQKA